MPWESQTIFKPDAVEDVSIGLNLKQVVVSGNVVEIRFFGVVEVRAGYPDLVDGLSVQCERRLHFIVHE